MSDYLETLAAVEKLRRDMRDAVVDVTSEEARFLVNAYYAMQKDRIRDKAQQRALDKAGAPHRVIDWLFTQHDTIERELGKALDTYSAAQPIGRWMRSIIGIGPVISAGLIAHIDIANTITTSQLWRFAGQDPTSEWVGRNAHVILKETRRGHEDPWDEFLAVCTRFVTRPTDLLLASGAITPEMVLTPEQAVDVVKTLTRAKIVLKQPPLYPDTPLSAGLVPPREAYAAAYPEAAVDWAAVSRVLTRRPWNEDLKRLCWLIGQSFVHTKNHPKAFYGKIYDARKEREVAKNARGDFAEQAARILKTMDFSRDTTARAFYKKGLLPPAHVHQRACRYAVKMFLSHLHEAWRTLEGLPVPEPHPLVFGGHAHKISCPNWDILQSEKAALQSAA